MTARKRPVFLFYLSVLLLTGCGGGNGGDDSGQNFPPSLVGRWRVASVSAGDSTLACPGTLISPNAALACGASDTYVFVEDFRDGARSAGTFRLESQQFLQNPREAATITPGQGNVATGRYTLENGLLTLTFDPSGTPLVRDGTSNTIFVGETAPGTRGGAFSLSLSDSEAILTSESVPLPRQERWTRL